MKLTAYLFILFTGLYIQLSCSKTGGIPPPPPPDPCSLVNVNLNGAVTSPSVPGASDGMITMSATGGTNFTYSINGGALQSSNIFKNLGAGNYTIMGRSSEGCIASLSLVVTNPTISCSSVNIVVSATATSNIPCEAASASLTATASGGTAPYTYSLDGSAFQSSNSFGGLVSGSHSVIAKDANGCTGSNSSTVVNQAAGPLFLQVRSVIQNHCVYCHSTTSASGGISYSLDCNIVDNKARIKARAVDGNPSFMPAGGIPAAERQKIIDWINAGGTFSN